MESIQDELITPIRIFEKLFKCHISFHDYTGFMRKNLGPLNYVHLNMFCATVKKAGQHPCVSFDFHSVQSELFSRRKMLFKICHANIIELVVPVFIREQLSGAMFAGPFRVSENNSHFSDIFGKPGTKSCAPELKKLYDQLPELDASDSEAVKCFAGLIIKNLERYAFSLSGLAAMPFDRRERIKFFIDNNFRKSPSLSDLAKYMGLSVPRISQLLNKFFGKGISVMVMEEKIKHAERLLCNSFFTMEVIGHECGFSSPSYFFRTFRKMRGCTPAEYRERNSNQSVHI